MPPRRSTPLARPPQGDVPVFVRRRRVREGGRKGNASWSCGLAGWRVGFAGREAAAGAVVVVAGGDIRDGDACLLYLAFGRSGAVLGVWGRRRMLVLRSCFCLGDKQLCFLAASFPRPGRATRVLCSPVWCGVFVLVIAVNRDCFSCSVRLIILYYRMCSSRHRALGHRSLIKRIIWKLLDLVR